MTWIDYHLTKHAARRMARYQVPEALVVEALAEPDKVVPGHSGRKIAQKARNG